ncbi:hypothetical protein [Prochlorococcus marinus]|uniref:hypothetical protein n=1 Tax=Prochlorococcus marinus TaxID=1219 RepID=UPI0012DA53BC|nr:hypothetical protein [Prochlorococcus marinus]
MSTQMGDGGFKIFDRYANLNSASVTLAARRTKSLCFTSPPISESQGLNLSST